MRDLIITILLFVALALGVSGCDLPDVPRDAASDKIAVETTWHLTFERDDEAPQVYFHDDPECDVDGIPGIWQSEKYNLCGKGYALANWDWKRDENNNAYPVWKNQEAHVLYEHRYARTCLVHELLHLLIARTDPSKPNGDPGHTDPRFFDRGLADRARQDLVEVGL